MSKFEDYLKKYDKPVLTEAKKSRPLIDEEQMDNLLNAFILEKLYEAFDNFAEEDVSDDSEEFFEALGDLRSKLVDSIVITCNTFQNDPSNQAV